MGVRNPDVHHHQAAYPASRIAARIDVKVRLCNNLERPPAGDRGPNTLFRAPCLVEHLVPGPEDVCDLVVLCGLDGLLEDDHVGGELGKAGDKDGAAILPSPVPTVDVHGQDPHGTSKEGGVRDRHGRPAVDARSPVSGPWTPRAALRDRALTR